MEHLVLTGLDNFSHDQHNKFEFTGPWCFLNDADSEKYWQTYSFEPTFKSGAELKSASDYVLKLCTNLISLLADDFNKIHQRNYSIKYWHTILMPWLSTAVQVLYERYVVLSKYIDNGKLYSVEVLLTGGAPNFNSVREFKKFVLTAEGNHYLFSLLIKSLMPENFHLNDVSRNCDITKDELVDSYTSRYQKLIRNFKRNIARHLSVMSSKIGGVYLEGVYGISLWDNFLINIKCIKKQNAKLKNLPKLPLHSEPKHKDLLKEWEPKNQFESLLSDILPRLLPQTYYDEYYNYEKSAYSTCKKLNKQTSLFVLGPLLGGYEPMKFIVAQFREMGGKVAINQHGANYGTADSFPFMASFEYLNVDYFISWGWENQSNYKVNAVPLPSPMLSKLSTHSHNNSGELIFIGTLISLYSDRLASNPQPQQCFEYRENKKNFLHALTPKILSKTLYRPYYSEAGSLPERAYIKEHFPEIRMLLGNMDKKFLDSRCIVMDHPGTTFNIALAMNKPVVAFWNPEHWKMCHQAEHILNRMKDVGIVHDSAILAARHVEEIWQDVFSWWDSPSVKEARELFVTNYARTSANWMSEWSNFILNFDESAKAA